MTYVANGCPANYSDAIKKQINSDLSCAEQYGIKKSNVSPAKPEKRLKPEKDMLAPGYWKTDTRTRIFGRVEKK